VPANLGGAGSAPQGPGRVILGVGSGRPGSAGRRMQYPVAQGFRFRVASVRGAEPSEIADACVMLAANSFVTRPRSRGRRRFWLIA
jgi:hypothetical protein